MPTTGCASRPSRQPELLSEEPELGICIDADAAAGTVTIRDNGIGMTPRGGDREPRHHRQVRHRGVLQLPLRRSAEGLRSSSASSASGSIPRSSSRTGSRCSRARPARRPRRACAGNPRADGEFTVETVERAERGTAVTLHLKDDAKEFADACRLRALIRRYSDHIGFPVLHAQGRRGVARVRGGEPGEGAVDAAAHRDQGRGIQAVLPARRARLHRPARLEPQQGRGQARVHEPAVHARRGRRSTCGSATRRAA